jgi:hypothetical protein
VNDIEVECGNSLFHPILDRYIAGEDVAFTEVRKVGGTLLCQCAARLDSMNSLSPVRAINQKLPAGRRLRVLAGDPPMD